MALDIVIDGRRVRDFGIGTYIRSLVHALSRIDTANHYTVVTGPGEARVWGALPDNFRIALYAGDDHAYTDHLLFPIFLRRLKPDLVHIPLNRVPLLMIRPYVVTIHDMVNLFYDERKLSAAHMYLRRFRFRRGLTRASRVIAVSEATKRDAENLLGVPPAALPACKTRPTRAFWGATRLRARKNAAASWSVTRSTGRFSCTRAPSVITRTSRGWWKPSRCCGSNWRRIRFMATCAW